MAKYYTPEQWYSILAEYGYHTQFPGWHPSDEVMDTIVECNRVMWEILNL